MMPTTARDPEVAETIVAVATPPGRSVRGMVRISGRAVASLIDEHLGSEPPVGELSITRLSLGQAQLPCLALRSEQGRSFTGEDALELWLPGNPAVLERALHRFTAHDDVRLAEAGEFTRRAFQAGRITLTEAEGIAATISAVGDAQLIAAGAMRRGELGRWAIALADRLAGMLALVEAGIDFTDQEDVVPIAPEELRRRVDQMIDELNELLARSRSWSQLEALPRVVLAGEPNAGKSTLFNALLGHDRAVISGQAGTTRDVLAEPLRLAGDTEVMLIDIAGLDQGDGLIDGAMQRAARDALDTADLVVWLSAADAPMQPPSSLDGRTLVVTSKADVAGGDGVSAVTGEGVEALRRSIADRLADHAVSVAGEGVVLRARHREAIEGAVEALALANTRNESELIAEQLRVSLDRLGELAGHIDPDDVIGRVFAEFCVGK